MYYVCEPSLSVSSFHRNALKSLFNLFILFYVIQLPFFFFLFPFSRISRLLFSTFPQCSFLSSVLSSLRCYIQPHLIFATPTVVMPSPDHNHFSTGFMPQKRVHISISNSRSRWYRVE